jgi:hypothetical protein
MCDPRLIRLLHIPCLLGTASAVFGHHADQKRAKTAWARFGDVLPLTGASPLDMLASVDISMDNIAISTVAGNSYVGHLTFVWTCERMHLRV